MSKDKHRYPDCIEDLPDAELKVLAKIFYLLKPLSPRARSRIMNFAHDHFDEEMDGADGHTERS